MPLLQLRLQLRNKNPHQELKKIDKLHPPRPQQKVRIRRILQQLKRTYQTPLQKMQQLAKLEMPQCQRHKRCRPTHTQLVLGPKKIPAQYFPHMT